MPTSKPHTSKSHTSKPSSYQVSVYPRATVLTVAGSDPSGGAGLQADLKTFHELGAYGMSAVALITVQNTLGVSHVETLSPKLLRDQLDAVRSDIPPRAIKTGALGTAENIHTVAEALADYRGAIVVDPVLISKRGDRLADDDCVAAYRDALLPLATIATPNRHEVQALTGRLQKSEPTHTDFEAWIGSLTEMGVRCPLIKAGRVQDKRLHVLGLEEDFIIIGVPDLPGVSDLPGVPDLPNGKCHGAGCCLSACITARLAIAAGDKPSDAEIREACEFAILAVHTAISVGPKYGQGESPIEMRILRHAATEGR
ncbi:MAG: hydroxymethylpyrimidine/phosphomethylpyrimidine kinase [Planctomycetota bacterium]